MSEELRVAKALQDEAALEGFDWPTLAPLWDKLAEEIAELREATSESEARVRDELGDLLFMIVNLARHLRIDPESALAQANEKFRRRYAHVRAHRESWSSLDVPAQRLDAMEALWQEAKRLGL